MKLNIQLNLTRWFRPRIHVFGIITWLRLNNNNKKALTCYKVFIIWLISRFSHYAFIKQNVIYSRARRLWKGRHKPTYEWLKWLIPGWMLLYSQHSNRKFPMCFFLFACFHFPKFCLSSLTSPLPWVISAHIISPVSESSSSVWDYSEIALDSKQWTQLFSDWDCIHSPMGAMTLRREAPLTKPYSDSCHLFELDYKLLRAGTLFGMCL